MTRRMKRVNKSNLYETDYDLLYTTDEFEELPKIANVNKKQSKRAAKLATIAEKQSGGQSAPKPIKKSPTKVSSNLPLSPTNVFNEVISSKPVECTCNKCNAPVSGELLSSLYHSITNLEIPFIRYSCKNCGHHGHRSVTSKGLPPKQFESYYF